jgi:hypothetical protein
MAYFLKLVKNDLRNVIRDRFLVFGMFIYPIMIIIFSRILVHLISPRIQDSIEFASPAFFPVFFLLFSLFIPIIFGFISSFLLLDEKDEHLLTVLKVMPISRNNFLAIRMFFMSLFAFIILLIFPPLSGLIDTNQFNYFAYIPVAILYSLFTPFIALLVSTFATNKVQAFAIFKISATVFMLPLFAFFLIQDNFKYIFSPIPNFWTFMSLDSVVKNGTLDFVPLVIGFAYHIALIAILFYIFNKKN